MAEDHFTSALKLRRQSLRATLSPSDDGARPSSPSRMLFQSGGGCSDGARPSSPSRKLFQSVVDAPSSPSRAKPPPPPRPAPPPTPQDSAHEVAVLSKLAKRQRSAVEALLGDGAGALDAYDPRATVEQLEALVRELASAGDDGTESVRHQLRLLISLEKELRAARRRGAPADEVDRRLGDVEARVGAVEARVAHLESTVAVLARALLKDRR